MTDKVPLRNGPSSRFRMTRPREGPSDLDVPSTSFISPPTPADAEFSFDSSTSETASRPNTAFLTDDSHTANNTTLTSSSRSRRNSSLGSLSELKGHLRRRSTSSKSKAGRTSLTAQLDNLAFRNPTDLPPTTTTSLQRPTISPSALSNQPSNESVNRLEATAPRPPLPVVEPRPRVPPFPSGTKREDGFRPAPSLTPTPNGSLTAGRSVSLGQTASAGGSLNNPRIVFQHIQDIATKRISTLDYLRKAHEGRVFWFNALRFTKEDLQKIPYFEPRRLSRRATNYLLLGVSIPAILDPHKDVAAEYLRQFNTLLSEFESYQSIHTPDGTAAPSRARIPQMFRRATQGPSSNKGRRTSSSTEGMSPQNSGESGEARSAGGLHSAGSASSHVSFPASDQELLPGEDYNLLLTPSIPFDPDYFETFATLCDVLIDCYTRVMGLVNTPEEANSNIGDLFSKVDSKVRKILIAGLVRDFEEASKQGIKSELAGIGKVTLGGLM